MQVRVALYSGGHQLVELIFDGAFSDNLNWFSYEKLQKSPYVDIGTEPRNYFSVPGHEDIERYFFINSQYPGCPHDLGWLATTGDACDWETAHDYPGILYTSSARGPTGTVAVRIHHQPYVTPT